MSRWYMTQGRISTFNPDSSPQCFWGCADRSTLLHIWWTFPVASRFWSKIYDLLCSILHITLTKNPWATLVHKPIPHLNIYKWKLVGFVFLVARHTLAKPWIQKSITFSEVKQHFLGTMVHKKLTSILTDNHTKFLKVWEPWLYYIKYLNIDHSLLSLQYLFHMGLPPSCFILTNPSPPPSFLFTAFFLSIYFLVYDPNSSDHYDLDLFWSILNFYFVLY